jgi:hypothetical protein
VWNGLLIGTGVGLAAGIVIASGEGCESGSCIASGVLVFTGIGAGIGAAVDMAIQEREIVYSNPQTTRILRISPMFDKRVARVRVLFFF